MRVSTAYFTQRGLTSMLQIQIASGKRLIRPSDDPTGAAQILRLQQTISTTNQFQRNSKSALNRLTLEEATLDNVQNTLLRVRDLAIQGSNSTLSNTDRLALAQEARERLNELMGLANTRDANQEYLFSGYQVTTKPFSRAANGSFLYNGDQGQRAIQISSGRQIKDSDSGNDVFTNLKNGNGTFQINGKAFNTVIPGGYTAAVANGNNATATENTLSAITGTDGGAAVATVNTVTAIAGTDGGAGGQQFILTIDGVSAVNVTFGAGETVATAAIAAELDSDLATFIAGTTYSITSGSLSGGDLVLSKADGTSITFDTSTSTLTGVAASITESQTTAGTPGEQFILTIDGLGAVSVRFGAGETIATAAIAAELDSDLAAFIAGSGGAYSITSGSLSGGDLVLSKADGTAITFDTSTSTLTATAASVTESETTAGVTASATTDTAFTMSVDGTQFFTEAAAIGGSVTAAELDLALTTFVGASGGAYTIESGTIAAGNLIMSKADGSSVALTIDSNFSGTVGSFSGPLVSASNTGSGIFNIGQVVDPSAYVAETYTVSFVTNGNGNLAYNVFGSVSGQLIPASGNPATNAPDFVSESTIEFNGIQTGFTGAPAVGDTFTVTPSKRQDMFTTVQNLVSALELSASSPSEQSGIFNTINQSLTEIDIAFDNIIRIRTNVGARLKTIDDQIVVNESFKIELTSTLSSVQDLDIAQAAVELQTRLISLQAAQAAFTRIQGLSLFDFI